MSCELIYSRLRFRSMSVSDTTRFIDIIEARGHDFSSSLELATDLLSQSLNGIPMDDSVGAGHHQV